MKIKAPKDYLKEPYAYKLTPEEDGGYSAEVEEFEGCFSQGDTADDAIANIFEAAENWIESMLRRGKPIPPPFAEIEASGKFALRMPVSLHDKVQKLALRDKASLNSFIVEALAEKVGAIEYVDRHMVKLEEKMARRTVANLAAMLLGGANVYSTQPRTASTLRDGARTIEINTNINLTEFGEWQK